jgi:hypothetical protein
MALDLAPDTERRVREYAEEQGVSIEILMVRAFPPRIPKPDQKSLDLAAIIRQWQMDDATEDEEELERRDQERLELQINLDKERKQANMRFLFPKKDQ